MDLAEEKSQLDPIHADVDTLASLVKDNGKLKEMLFNPVVDSEKKTEVLARIAKEAGFNKYTQNFLNLLVKKDRINLLDEICESFEEQYCTITDTQVRDTRGLGEQGPRGGAAQGMPRRVPTAPLPASRRMQRHPNRMPPSAAPRPPVLPQPASWGCPSAACCRRIRAWGGVRSQCSPTAVQAWRPASRRAHAANSPSHHAAAVLAGGHTPQRRQA